MYIKVTNPRRLLNFLIVASGVVGAACLLYNFFGPRDLPFKWAPFVSTTILAIVAYCALLARVRKVPGADAATRVRAINFMPDGICLISREEKVYLPYAETELDILVQTSWYGDDQYPAVDVDCVIFTFLCRGVAYQIYHSSFVYEVADYHDRLAALTLHFRHSPQEKTAERALADFIYDQFNNQKYLGVCIKDPLLKKKFQFLCIILLFSFPPLLLLRLPAVVYVCLGIIAALALYACWRQYSIVARIKNLRNNRFVETRPSAEKDLVRETRRRMLKNMPESFISKTEDTNVYPEETPAPLAKAETPARRAGAEGGVEDLLDKK